MHDAQLKAGTALHRQGRLDEACAIYRQVVAADPSVSQAWHWLGLADHEAGRNEQALVSLARAIALESGVPLYHQHRGATLVALGRLDEADVSFRQALALHEANAQLHFHLGALMQTRDDGVSAEKHYRRALELDPNLAEVQFNLAQVFRDRGETGQASAAYRAALAARPAMLDAALSLGALDEERGDDAAAERCWLLAIEHHPSNAEGHFRLGTLRHRQGDHKSAESALCKALELNPQYAEVHNNLGCIYRDRNELDRAEASFRAALAIRPSAPMLLVNLASVLHKKKDLQAATDYYQKALEVEPNHNAAHAGLAAVQCEQKLFASAAEHFSQSLRGQHNAYDLVSLGAATLFSGRRDDALVHLRRAIADNPNDARAHCTLGVALFFHTRVEESLASFARALAIEPEMAESHYNRALTLLLSGALVEGWREYAWRNRVDDWPVQTFSQPEWDGSPLDGRTLLVYAEQGLGDTLQFIRFVREAEQQGPVWIEVQPALMPLLRASGFRRLVPANTPLPSFDVHLPLMSLPHHFGNTPAEIGRHTNYLAADPSLTADWRPRLRETPGLKVGIAWQGNAFVTLDQFRSIPLTAFAALAAVPGVELISLQKHDGAGQLSEIEGRFTVRDLGSRLDDEHGAFMDTAAVIENLDLVVTSDTAIAHLAGGLGKPVWLALCATPDWRWMLSRPDTPWYPSMRLFRQQTLGDWEPVFLEMARTIQGPEFNQENHGNNSRR